MPKLEVSLTLELDGHLLFERWLPIANQEEIIVSERNVETHIHFKLESAWRAYQPTTEELFKWVNVHAYRLYITSFATISPELSEYILTHRRNEIESTFDTEISGIDKNCIDEYRQLGLDMQKTIVRPINRLIEYARAIKGQFQIEPIVPDLENPGQFFMRNKVRANIDGNQIDFNPDYSVKLKISVIQKEETYINADDWPDVLIFIHGTQRAPLPGSLLATAKSLLENNMRRNALVEAVSALEVSLSEFVNRYGEIQLSNIRARIESENIKSLHKKLGLRGSFDVMLPMLFDEKDLPINMLHLCRKAIEARNNVVHNGGRPPIDGDLRTMLNAIDECCRRFRHIISARNSEVPD